MSTQPDWSTAPSGATHYRPSTRRWYRQDSFAYEWNGFAWCELGCSDLGEYRWSEQLIERPAQMEWDGEGLPPVGTVCEWKGQNGGYWVECEVVAVSLRQFVLRHADSSVYRPGQFEIFRTDPLQIQFRPIRTPEQIAAEEREKAIGEMLRIVGGADRRAAENLYDAGYRKHDDQQLHELQGSSEIHQANRELAEQRLRRLAEIQDEIEKREADAADSPASFKKYQALVVERTEILSHYREPQA